MPPLPGGDSATPKPTQYQGKRVWGVYVAGATPHVWTKAEVAALGLHGVEGVMPIVVPPQGVKWWEVNHGYAVLEQLVREAIAWGVPAGSPLCLDVEEYQGAQMPAPADVCHAWAVATRTHKLRTWTYGGQSFLANDHWGFRWLAQWPNATPHPLVLPAGFNAWQYHGNDNGIDHDIFEGGRDYLSPHLRVVVLPTPPVPHPAGPINSPSRAVLTRPSAAPELPGVVSPSSATPPMTGSPPQVLSGSAPSIIAQAHAHAVALVKLLESAPVTEPPK